MKFTQSTYKVTITGNDDGLLMHAVEISMDPDHPWTRKLSELNKKGSKNKTEFDLREIRKLECQSGLWYKRDTNEKSVEIPTRVLRAAIEEGAKRLREGPKVRGGLIVTSCDHFIYRFQDVPLAELCSRAYDDPKGGLQFKSIVTVQRAKILRTRALFKDWQASFTIEVEDDLVDKRYLETWLKIAGRQIGIGDWRPAKSGVFGRFTAKVEMVEREED